MEFLDSLRLTNTRNIFLSETGLSSEEITHLLHNNTYTIQSLSQKFQLPTDTNNTTNNGNFHGGFISTLVSTLNNQNWSANNTTNNIKTNNNNNTIAPLSPNTSTNNISTSSITPIINRQNNNNSSSRSSRKSPLLSSPLPNSNNNNNNGYNSDSFDDVEEQLELSTMSNTSTNNLIQNGGLLSSPFHNNNHTNNNNSLGSSTGSIKTSSSNHINSNIYGPGGRISPNRDILPVSSNNNNNTDNLLTNSVILSPINNNNNPTSPNHPSSSNTSISPSNAHVAEMQARYSVFTTVPGLHPSNNHHTDPPLSPSHHASSPNTNTNNNNTRSISKALGLSNDIGKLVIELEKQENNHNTLTNTQILSSPTIDQSPLPSSNNSLSLEESMPSLNSTSPSTSNTVPMSSQLFHPNALAEHGYIDNNTINKNNTTKSPNKQRSTITPFISSLSGTNPLQNNADEFDDNDEFTNQQLLSSEDRHDNDRIVNTKGTKSAKITNNNELFNQTFKGNNKQYHQLQSLNEDITNENDEVENNNNNNSGIHEEDGEEDVYSPSTMRRSIKSVASRFSDTQRTNNDDEPELEDIEEDNNHQSRNESINFNNTLRVPLSQLTNQHSSPSVSHTSSTMKSPGNNISNTSNNEDDYYGSEFDNDSDISNMVKSPGFTNHQSPVKANTLLVSPTNPKKSFLGDLPPVSINNKPTITTTQISNTILPPTIASPAEQIDDEEFPNYDDEFDASNGNSHLLNITNNTSKNYSNISGNLGDSEDNHNHHNNEDDEVDLSRSPY